MEYNFVRGTNYNFAFACLFLSYRELSDQVNQCVLYSVLTANISLDGATGKAILPSVLKNINKLSQLLVKYSK